MAENTQETNAMNILLAIRDNLLKPMTAELQSDTKSNTEELYKKLSDSFSDNDAKMKALAKRCILLFILSIMNLLLLSFFVIYTLTQ